MAKVSIVGNPSGTGTLQIAAPNTNSNYTLTLPTQTGNILTSATTTGFPAGSVLQVVNVSYSTSTTTTSTSWTTTNLSASITPSSTTSKIAIICSLPVYTESKGTYSGFFTVFRGTTAGTNLGNVNTGFGVLSTFLNAFPYTALGINTSFCFNYLDSPSTTSSQTYTIAMRSEGNSNPVIAFISNAVGTLTLMEIAA